MRWSVISMFVVVALLVSQARALTPQNVLLLYNSQNFSSATVAAAYLAARPGILALDLNDSALNTGTLSRADYVVRVRDPVRRFINGVDANGQPQGPDLSDQIIAIVTTNGLPARIFSPAGFNDEFLFSSAWASMESELTLLQQDLEAPGSGVLAQRYNGFVKNPYHTSLNTPIHAFSRSNVQSPKTFVAVPLTGSPLNAMWSIQGLTPGDIYLVCRLDAAATPGGPSARDNTLALIQRSLSLQVDRCAVRALLDEWAAPPSPTGFELDDASVPPLIPGPPDFENAAAFLEAFGVSTLHDKTFNFVTGPELPTPPPLSTPLLVLGTYGENHSGNGWGENPPGDGVYVQTYTFHPASVFIAYESWGGTSLYSPGTQRGGQQQALDVIALGGSFTIATVMEPRAFAIADLQFLLPNMLIHGMSFAEAAYASIPVLSWQSIPVGDPLARISVFSGALPTDRDGDGRLDVEDLYANAMNPVDHDCDGSTTPEDSVQLRRIIRAAEAFDVVPLPLP